MSTCSRVPRRSPLMSRPSPLLYECFTNGVDGRRLEWRIEIRMGGYNFLLFYALRRAGRIGAFVFLTYYFPFFHQAARHYGWQLIERDLGSGGF